MNSIFKFLSKLITTLYIVYGIALLVAGVYQWATMKKKPYVDIEDIEERMRKEDEEKEKKKGEAVCGKKSEGKVISISEMLKETNENFQKMMEEFRKKRD